MEALYEDIAILVTMDTMEKIYKLRSKKERKSSCTSALGSRTP